jgi:hypothetical protein
MRIRENLEGRAGPRVPYFTNVSGLRAAAVKAVLGWAPLR